MITESDLIKITLIFIFLLFSAFFSSSETALFSLGRWKIRHITRKKNLGAKRIDALFGDAVGLLITLLFFNTLVNIFAASLSTSIFEPRFQNYGLYISIAVMTFIILIAGEIIPKVIAFQLSEKIALLFAPVVYLFYQLISPIRRILTSFTNILVPGYSSSHFFDHRLTEEELKELVYMGEEFGEIDLREREMTDRILKLKNIQIKSIMVPRIEIVMVPETSSIEDVLNLVIKTGHSRIPVYRDSPDDIIGIINAKSLLDVQNPKAKINEVREILQKPYFVPLMINAASLLKNFKKKRKQMAIVIDEFGGCAGLVTLEDVIEEMVGELYDKFDQKISYFKPLKNGRTLALGSTPIDEFNNYFKTNIEDEKIVTIAGYILKHLERIPHEGESIDIDGLKVEIIRMTGSRIKLLSIFKNGKNAVDVGGDDG